MGSTIRAQTEALMLLRFSDSSKSQAIRTVLHWQYKSICRGAGSLMDDLNKKRARSLLFLFKPDQIKCPALLGCYFLRSVSDKRNFVVRKKQCCAVLSCGGLKHLSRCW